MLPYYGTKGQTKRVRMSNNLSLRVFCVVLQYFWVRRKEEKKKIAQRLVTGSTVYIDEEIVGGDVLWHTSRMKSPVLSPALSALLPGSTLSRYCRAGNSAEGRKSSSAVAWVWAVKQILKYKSCNVNPSDTASILTHFLSNMKEIYVPNFCLPFYTSLKAMDFQSIPFLGSGVNQKHWLAKMTSRKKQNIYILKSIQIFRGGCPLPSRAFELWPCCCSCFFLLDPLPSLGLAPTA